MVIAPLQTCGRPARTAGGLPNKNGVALLECGPWHLNARRVFVSLKIRFGMRSPSRKLSNSMQGTGQWIDPPPFSRKEKMGTSWADSDALSWCTSLTF